MTAKLRSVFRSVFFTQFFPAAILSLGFLLPTAQAEVFGAAPEKPLHTKPVVADAKAVAAQTAGQTEFQQFLEKSTGKKLELYGRNVFAAKSGYNASSDIPVPVDYVVGPGDELVIKAWGAVEIDYRATIDRSGVITIPRVGSMMVAGTRYSELPMVVSKAIGRVYKNFEVSVSLGQMRSIGVYVVGKAQSPGRYTVPSGASILNALIAAGGPNASGSMRKITVRRDGKVISEFDLYDFLLKGDKSKDVRLAPEDIVFVGEMGKQVAVTGSVNAPGIYEVKDKSDVSELISWAGGLSSVASNKMVTIERMAGSGMRKVEDGNYDTLAKRALDNGDLVTIYAVRRQFENAVTLRGAVTQAMRFEWKSGMKVSDIIPSKNALISEEYLLERESLAVKKEAGDAQREPNAMIKRPVREINWDYAVVERLSDKDLSTQLLPFNLSKALEREATNNLALQPGDVITILSMEDLSVPRAKQTQFVRLEGEFNQAGVYRVQPGETLQQLVARVGGLTGDAFLFGGEFTRESVRRDQQSKYDEMVRRVEQDGLRTDAVQVNLSGEDAATARNRAEAKVKMVERLKGVKTTGRMIMNMPVAASKIADIPSLVLEDGDRFYIPPKPATVNVYGAVYNEGSVVLRQGNKVADILALVGGAQKFSDVKNTFVVRADGSVASMRGANAVEDLALLPGDTIFVPEEFDRTTMAKTLKDWTSILYQFGTGVLGIRYLWRY